MIDIVSTQIVSYQSVADSVDDKPYIMFDNYQVFFDGAYPIWKSGFSISNSVDRYNHTSERDPAEMYHEWDIQPTGYYLKEGDEGYDYWFSIIGNTNKKGIPIYAAVLLMFDHSRHKADTVINSIGVCYYVYSSSRVPFDKDPLATAGCYYRLRSTDIPSNIKNPFTDKVNLGDVEDIYWLHDLGRTVVTMSSQVASILTFDFLGMDLLSLLTVTGFTVYMGIKLGKFFVGR